MDELKKQELLDRNNQIIEMIKEIIEKECPGAVDLIGIGGSFCSGDFYENSDLDLVIISNSDKASVLNKCFILGDIGFDIYTTTWERLESMSEYNNPYVTKLFDLDIVYTKDDDVLAKYSYYQNVLKDNMNNTSLIEIGIRNHLSDAITSQEEINSNNSLSLGYRNLAKLVTDIEYIIYMINRKYVVKGTKRVPEEIKNMKLLPEGFLDIYLDIYNCSSIEDIREKTNNLIDMTKKLLIDNGININVEKKKRQQEGERKDITSDDLVGTYEEIYSNWGNKMYHASKINNRYLSFNTMASVQSFYDDMAKTYNIPVIELIGSYNPHDLDSNARNYNKALSEWKKLYDTCGLKVQIFNSIDDLKKSYIDEKYKKQ